MHGNIAISTRKIEIFKYRSPSRGSLFHNECTNFLHEFIHAFPPEIFPLTQYPSILVQCWYSSFFYELFIPSKSGVMKINISITVFGLGIWQKLNSHRRLLSKKVHKTIA